MKNHLSVENVSACFAPKKEVLPGIWVGEERTRVKKDKTRQEEGEKKCVDRF